MAKRQYEVGKGNNISIFGGRLIFGPDARSLIITLLLIIVPVIIFCTDVARNLSDEISGNIAGYAILMVTVVFTIYVLLLLLLTSARDPGIVPRNLHPPTERLPPTKEVVVNGLPVRVKYCSTCLLYRPPRCSHCSECDNCVERFDHHCPWVGQCIGMRNYRSFFLLISSSTILCIFIFTMSALNIKFLMDDYGTVWKAMKESPLSVVLMVYCFIFLWFVGGLTCLHLYLIGTNQTTYETFQSRRLERPRVYDRGCLNNFREVLCSRIKPSRNNFHAYVQENERGSTLGMTSETYANDLDGNRQEKVEDDQEIGRSTFGMTSETYAGDLDGNQREKVEDDRKIGGFTLGMTSETYAGDLDGNRGEKVEDDREIGGDLLKISQRREANDA